MALSQTARLTRPVMTQPGRLEIVQFHREPLGPDEVRIRVIQCGLCQSEVDAWSGRSREQWPIEIGHEVAGVVEEIGSEVSAIALGETVTAWVLGGGFASELVARERFCVPVSADAAFPAVGEPLSCIVNAVHRAAPALGDDVVIVGAGFMGLLLLELSLLAGARSVTVADLRDDARQRAREHGATHTVDPRAETLDAIADVSYEVTGTAGGLALASSATRMSGKLAIVGYHQGGTREIDLAHWNWMAFELVNCHFRELDTIMHGLRRGMRLVSAGRLRPESLITHRFGLEELERALTVATDKPDGFVKAVLEPAAP